jgi:hypothetical protein
MPSRSRTASPPPSPTRCTCASRRRRARTRVAPSLAAYDLYLRGSAAAQQPQSADALRQASEYFDRAIELEPRFALAWAAKASVIAPQAYFATPPRLRRRRAAPAHRARARAGSDAGRGARVAGVLKLFYEWDWDAAQASHCARHRAEPERRPRLAPSRELPHRDGRRRRARARERAVQLDPLNARTRIVLSRDYWSPVSTIGTRAGAPRGAARSRAPAAARLGAGLPIGRGRLSAAGTRRRSRRGVPAHLAALRGATVRRCRTCATRTRVPACRHSGRRGWRWTCASPVRRRIPCAWRPRTSWMGDTAQALDWLDRAFDERSPALIFLRQDAAFSGMSSHPRIMRIVRAMQFPD